MYTYIISFHVDDSLGFKLKTFTCKIYARWYSKTLKLCLKTLVT